MDRASSPSMMGHGTRAAGSGTDSTAWVSAGSPGSILLVFALRMILRVGTSLEAAG